MRSHIVLAAIIITIYASTCYAFEPGMVGNSIGIVGLLDTSEIPHPLYSTGEINIPHVWVTPEPLYSFKAPSTFFHNAGTSDVTNNVNRSIITTDTFSLCGGAGNSRSPHVLNPSGGLGLSNIFQFHKSGPAGSAPLCPFANR